MHTSSTIDCIILLFVDDYIYVAATLHYVSRTDRKTGLMQTIMGFPGQSVTSTAIDGTPSTAVTLRTPHSLWTDTIGNLFVNEIDSHRVRRIDSSMKMFIFAGRAGGSFSGDGGPATSATFNRPHGIMGENGKDVLYISEEFSHRIRKVYKSGSLYLIGTIAGTSSSSQTMDCQNIPATSCRLNEPNQVWTTPSGDVYFSQFRQAHIRRLVPLVGGTTLEYTIFTVVKLVNNVQGVCLDSTGNLYFTAFYNSVAYVLPSRSYEPQIIAGIDNQNSVNAISGDGGLGSLAKINGMKYIYCDQSTGMVYIATSEDRRVRSLRFLDVATPQYKIAKAVGGGTTFVGDGSVEANAEKMLQVHGIFISGMRLIITASQFICYKILVFKM